MTTLAETYLRKGDDAVAEMETETDPFLRRMWDKVADHWHELAERVDRQGVSEADLWESPQPPLTKPKSHAAH